MAGKWRARSRRCRRRRRCTWFPAGQTKSTPWIRAARGWLLRGASAMAAVGFGGFFAARNQFGVLVAATALFSLARAPLASMTDAQTFDAVRREGGSYGRIRLWGSIGFLLAALAGGELLDRTNVDWVMRASLAVLVVMAAAAW